MQEQAMRRDWKRLRGAVAARWPRLTEDDLVAIDGDPAWLVDAIVARYGIERGVAEREWRAFAAHLGNGETGPFTTLGRDARNVLEPGAAKLREGITELAAGFGAIAREAGALGRERAGVAAEEAKIAAGERLGELGDQLETMFAPVTIFVRERPYAALGIAFVAGWLVFGRK
ncbi:MAG TPA: hypothetical protein VND91_04030 [Candidatus Saccharimonadia bacterium]|nr:hypothetical protein [Candidatus Saccharimonadia bacterium]